MKKLFTTSFFLALVFASYANHTKGGWIYYQYLGPGANANTARYSITLKLYTECFLNSNQWCPDVNISIFNAGDNTLYETVNVNYSDSVNIQNCTKQQCHPCISSIPNICYKIATFSFVKDLPITPAGYVVSYQRCCRIANIINLVPGSSSIGDTWSVNIPGTGSSDPLAYQNSSAQFAQNDTAIICKQNFFTFDFSAIDKDNDSLVYSFTDALYSSQGSNGGQCGSQSSSPPYSFVSYTAPFSGTEPLGSGVTINPVTGIVSGIAPATQGTYVLTCTVTEFKRGTNIIKSTVRKSLHISVTDCSLTQAVLDPEYFSCDSFSKSFSNNSPGGNIQTYFWDFGVAGSTSDTSNQSSPTFTYPDTGTYTLKLVVNRGLPCPDSTLSIVKVYPVFITDFSVQGQCKNTPITFKDLSTTTYGFVNSWTWDFGDQASPVNVATTQTAQHIYPTEALYNVSLTATNSKGCKATLIKGMQITDKPALNLTNDTLICVIDTLRLNIGGAGTVLWSPNYNINNLSSFSPLVSPDVPTKYYATLTDPYGCIGTDSVFVDVKQFVTLKAGSDTTICGTDAITLGLASDALSYIWTENPANGTLDDPRSKNPVAVPLVNTTYHVVGNIGKCVAADDIAVRVAPYPNANAGADTIICFGTSAQLQSSGGSFYSWSPSTFLTNAHISNPIAVTPSATLSYVVTVTDNLGCPKAVLDTISVIVSKINANAGPRDTVVVLDQPLQLNATGSVNYLWTPARWLSNPTISNPVALPQDDVVYTVKVSNSSGCFDVDSIRVKVYKLIAGFYVPSGFSPNGDGKNDNFRPIAIGMKSIDLFRVYNRWGQMLFNGTYFEEGGWDGTFSGRPQDPGTYVWYAEGTDFMNNKIKKRGYVVLIR
ncbi:MAG: PKD domain-containing protein [Ferruginibacter sp.]